MYYSHVWKITTYSKAQNKLSVLIFTEIFREEYYVHH